MKKYTDPEILDMLPHYLGAKVRITWEDGTTSDMIYEAHFTYMIFGSDLKTEADIEIDHVDIKTGKVKVQLYLHHPAYMTKYQKKQYDSLLYTNEFKAHGMTWKSDTPASLYYLFKNHIDAFNLIEKGIAIEIRKYRKNSLLEKLTPRPIHRGFIQETPIQIYELPPSPFEENIKL